MNQDPFKVGDVVKVAIRSNTENKIHASPFEGIVISVRGQGTGKTFTVRKMAVDKVAVERIFPQDSPLIESIKVIKKGNVRRAKLYYLRNK